MAEKPVMAQNRCLCFGLSHLWLKTGQFNLTGTKTEQTLKAFIHKYSSLNDHFLSVAKTKPQSATSGLTRTDVKTIQDDVQNSLNSLRSRHERILRKQRHSKKGQILSARD